MVPRRDLPFSNVLAKSKSGELKGFHKNLDQIPPSCNQPQTQSGSFIQSVPPPPEVLIIPHFLTLGATAVVDRCRRRRAVVVVDVLFPIHVIERLVSSGRRGTARSLVSM